MLGSFQLLCQITSASVPHIYSFKVAQCHLFMGLGFLRDLCEVLLYLLLPPGDFHNKNMRYFLRVRIVLLWIMDTAAHAAWCESFSAWVQLCFMLMQWYSSSSFLFNVLHQLSLDQNLQGFFSWWINFFILCRRFCQEEFCSPWLTN